MRWSFLGSVDQSFEEEEKGPSVGDAPIPPAEARGRREEGEGWSCWAMMWGKVVGDFGTEGSMVWARL